MSLGFFYKELGYDHQFLVDCQDVLSCYTEYADLQDIGADRVYFSDKYPVLLFKDVHSFSNEELKEIATIQHKAWNYRKVMFLMAVSDTEIRIYNCYEKPKYIKPNIDNNEILKGYEIIRSSREDKENLQILNNLFSIVAVDSGLLWTTENSIKDKVNIQHRIDNYLVNSLKNVAIELGKDIDNKDIVHGLLMRSLFILYLEDKGSASETTLYSDIQEGAKSYFDILKDKKSAYQLFRKLEEHFNGNAFPIIDGEQEVVSQSHLTLIKRCFTDGDISGSPKLFEDWRLFDFKFIQIELLSEIYENFLGELKGKKAKGQFYTPHTLVELILDDKLPTKNNDKNYNTIILDPTCGSGIFLVESYKRLIKRWKNTHKDKDLTFEILSELLTNNIYGIEFDILATKVTAFSLYLALIEQLDPKTLWIEKGCYRLPYLIKHASLGKKQGQNIICADTIGDIDSKEFIEADLLIGNPPFGAFEEDDELICQSIKDYCNKYSFAKEMVLPFLHKATDFCPKGNIALIFPTKVLTNTNSKFQIFRRWLFNQNTVKKVYNFSIFRNAKNDFGGQLFSSATVPTSIIYYQKENISNNQNRIEYCAPRTYVRSNLIDGIVMDSTDIKYLPQSECKKSDSKIWKIAMWGGLLDFNLIQMLDAKYSSLRTFLKKDWVHRTGLNGDKKRPDFIPPKVIETSSIDQYYTNGEVAVPNSKYYRAIKEEYIFDPPFLVIKKGHKDKKVTSSYIDEKQYFKTGAFIINSNNLNEETEKIKKALVAFINSDFATYYLFLTSSSWGIEREQIQLTEYLDLPAFFSNSNLDAISNLFDELIKEKKTSNNLYSINTIRKKIDTELTRNIFKFTAKEEILIEDCLTYNLNLFEKGENSISFNPLSYEDNESYAHVLNEEMNAFYEKHDIKLNSTIYDIGHFDPLNLVILTFENQGKEPQKGRIEDLRPLLNQLSEYSIQKKGKNIYTQKQFRHYDNDRIYLIKPNQKRFWTRSQAYEDAMSLILEIANMGG